GRAGGGTGLGQAAGGGQKRPITSGLLPVPPVPVDLLTASPCATTSGIRGCSATTISTHSTAVRTSLTSTHQYRTSPHRVARPRSRPVARQTSATTSIGTTAKVPSAR